jgi:tetratricopeptide (TPR) repeat protein
MLIPRRHRAQGSSNARPAATATCRAYGSSIASASRTDLRRLLERFWEARSDAERIDRAGEVLAPLAEAGERCRAQRLDVLGELYEALRREGQFERGLGVVRERNAAGWQGVPDGRCDEAEMLLRTGDRDGAFDLLEHCWSEADAPWWVANNAGLALREAGDHERAVEWLGRGIRAAMAGGDPERLVAQMSDLRRSSLEQLGREHDQLERDADTFLEAARNRAAATDERARAATTAFAQADFGAPRVTVAMAWFPSGDYERATERWPDGLERFTGVGHREYCRSIEADMRVLAADRTAGVRVSHVAPVSVDGLIEFSAEESTDPGSADTRSRLAAELLRRGDAIAWPPGRNDPCWCGSGAKYKRCCGTVEVGDDELRDVAPTMRAIARLMKPQLADDEDDEPVAPPLPSMIAVLDGFAAEFPPDTPDTDEDDEFEDLVGQELYPSLVELAASTPGEVAQLALDSLGGLLRHPVISGRPARVATVELALAEAFAAEGRPGLACELDEHAFRQLASADLEPHTVARAVALAHVIESGGLDAAEAGYRELLAERPGDAHQIAEIAGNAFRDSGHHDRALPWLRMNLELLLSATPARTAEIQRALSALRAASAAARVEPSPDLVRRAAEALAPRGRG